MTCKVLICRKRNQPRNQVTSERHILNDKSENDDIPYIVAAAKGMTPKTTTKFIVP